MRILLVLLFFQALSLQGQDRPAIDTLIKKGKEIVSDTPDESLLLTYRAYNESRRQEYYWGTVNAAGWIAEAYYYKGQMDSMDKYNHIALELSREAEDIVAIGDNLKSIGQSESDRGNDTEAMNYFSESLNFKERIKDTINIIDLHLRIGAVYDDLDLLDTAMIKYNIALSLSRTIDHKELIGQSLNNIAMLHKKLGQLDKSLETLEEAKFLFQSIDNTYGLLINANMLGVTYKSLGRYEEALIEYERLKELSSELNFKRGHMAYGINTGTIYNLLGKFKNGADSYRLAIKIADEFDIPLSLSDAKSGLSKSLLGLGKIKEAEREFTEALKIAEDIESLDKQLIAHKVGKEIYQKKKSLDKTVYHLEAIQALNDSIFQLEKAKQIDELQTKYETSKKDAKIQILNKNAQLDRAKKSVLWIGIGLLSLLAGGIIYGQIQRRKRIQEKAQREQQIEREKRQRVEQDLEFKKKELISKALQLASKNEFLQSLEKEVSTLKSSVDGKVSQTSQKITRMIHNDSLDDQEWDQFQKEFSSIHQYFIDKITKEYGDFSNHEWRLISLLKMNLSSKEIANILRISPDGVKKARYRLRKKINLESEIDIQDYLIQY